MKSLSSPLLTIYLKKARSFVYKNKRKTVGIGRNDFLKDHRDICIQV